MPAHDDLSSYLGLFLDEATDQIQLLENGILRLEGPHSDELLQEIFRAAHTLKGSSRAMGFDSIGELTHAMEDVLSLVRSGRLPLTRDLIDGLFTGVNQLSSPGAIASTGASQIDTSLTTTNLRSLVLESAGSGHSSAEVLDRVEPDAEESFRHAEPGVSVRLSMHDAFQCGLKVFEVAVKVAADCSFVPYAPTLYFRPWNASAPFSLPPPILKQSKTKSSSTLSVSS